MGFVICFNFCFLLIIFIFGLIFIVDLCLFNVFLLSVCLLFWDKIINVEVMLE